MDMNTKISGRILVLVASGKTLPEAFDEVLGKGVYNKMASELYETMKAKGA